MKKTILFALLIISTQSAFAQLSKGMFSIGLSSGFITSKTVNESDLPGTIKSNNTKKNTSFNITPTISYFISNRFALGIGVGYKGYTTITENINYDFPNTTQNYNYTKTTSSGVQISPYISYYMPISEHFYFLLKAGISSTFSNGKTSGYIEKTVYNPDASVLSTNKSGEYGPNKTATTDITAGISPAVLFLMNKKVGFQFGLGNIVAYNSKIDKTTYPNSSQINKTTNNGIKLFDINTITVDTGVYFFF